MAEQFPLWIEAELIPNSPIVVNQTDKLLATRDVITRSRYDRMDSYVEMLERRNGFGREVFYQ